MLFEKLDLPEFKSVGVLVSLQGNLYNHAMPPQSPSADNYSDAYEGIASASSTHDGVSVAFCDGHVASFGPDIDVGVWRSIADRKDGKFTQ